MRFFWKVLAIFEGLVILSGIALLFIYADYRTGNLPYDITGILQLIASVALLGLLFGGFIGWAIILSIIVANRQERAGKTYERGIGSCDNNNISHDTIYFGGDER